MLIFVHDVHVFKIMSLILYTSISFQKIRTIELDGKTIKLQIVSIMNFFILKFIWLLTYYIGKQNFLSLKL